MREGSFLRELLEMAGIYVVGAVVGFGWLVYGLFVYSQPIPANSQLGTDFNHDIGTSLVAHGLAFSISFIIGGAISILIGKRERKEVLKDRQMIREMHQLLQERKTLGNLPEKGASDSSAIRLDTDTNTTPADLPIWNGNSAQSEGDKAHLN